MSDIIETENIVEEATDLIGEALTGIPAPIKKNAFKALAQLCTAVIDIPVAHLEGLASEKRAETQARIEIINTGATKISEQMDVNPEYAKAAVKKYGQRIVRERVNLDMITEKAIQKIQSTSSRTSLPEDEPTLEQDISEDWLNTFEKEASEKSSEEMQKLFSSILAGEIMEPSTFSIKSVKTLSQLDNEIAVLFQTFCSLCISIEHKNTLVDVRVVSLTGSAASNSLQKYGLNFPKLNMLEEYGLIISDYNSNMDYGVCVVNGSKPASYALKYQSNANVLINLKPEVEITELKLSGVGLTKTGKELFKIIDVHEDEEYNKDFVAFLKGKNLILKDITH